MATLTDLDREIMDVEADLRDAQRRFERTGWGTETHRLADIECEILQDELARLRAERRAA